MKLCSMNCYQTQRNIKSECKHMLYALHSVISAPVVNYKHPPYYMTRHQEVHKKPVK